MKPREPIQLSMILEHYTQEKVLKRPKEQLVKQMEDLVTICDFLLHRIPTNMKAIKQTARAHHKVIKNFSDNLRNDVIAVNQSKPDKIFNLKSAYEQLNHFSFIKQADKQFVENTIPEKQMKLKFLESQKLPENFIWHKPGNKAKVSSKQQQFYRWCSHFNSILNAIEIVSQKHRILVGLKLENDKYCWTMLQIQAKINQDSKAKFVEYFQESVIPKLKQQFPQSYEEHMLACIHYYSYFLQLLQMNLVMCLLSNKRFFTQKITYKQEDKSYEFSFSLPLPLKHQALITVVELDTPDFQFLIKFNKKNTQALFRIKDLIAFKCIDQFKYENYLDIVMIFERLINFGKSFQKFIRNIGRQFSDLREYLFIKTNNLFWCQQNSFRAKAEYGRSQHPKAENKKQSNSKPENPKSENIRQDSYMLKSDGIFIGRLLENRFIYCNVLSNGKLGSSKVARVFLASLLKYVPTFNHIFHFVHVIETILQSTQHFQHELDSYIVRDRVKIKDSHRAENIDQILLAPENVKVSLYFRKKNNVEDQMARMSTKNSAVADEQSFNSFKTEAQFNIGFQQLTFYYFTKDPEITKNQYAQKQEWKNYFNRQSKKQENSLLNLKQVLQALQYAQNNTIFRCFIEKKMKAQSKQYFRIMI